MINYFQRLLESQDFMPHGHCYFWQPEILWTHVISDIIIFISYFSIPVALMTFIYRKPQVPYRWIFYLFSGFILVCGMSHITAVWTTWNPAYRFEGLVKACTAIISLITAISLWPLLPKAIQIPSIQELSQAKKSLKTLIEHYAKNAKIENDETQPHIDAKLIDSISRSREERILELKREVNLLSRQLGKNPPYLQPHSASGSNA